MENNLFEQLYKDYKRIDIVQNKITKIYSFRNNEKGNFYKDGNDLYPTANILDEDNKEHFEQYFDFDFEKLVDLAEDNIEITPAKISGKTIEKGTIKVKEKEEVIEETKAEEVVEESKVEANEELEEKRRIILELAEQMDESPTKQNIIENIKKETDLEKMNAFLTKIEAMVKEATEKANNIEETKAEEVVEEKKEELDEKLEESRKTALFILDNFKEKTPEFDKETRERILECKDLESLRIELINLNNYIAMDSKMRERTEEFAKASQKDDTTKVETSTLNDETIEEINQQVDNPAKGKPIETDNILIAEIFNFDKFKEMLKYNLLKKSEINELEETKAELLEELETLQEKYNIALKAGYNGQFKQGENTTDIYPKIKELEEKIKEIDLEIKSKEKEQKDYNEYIETINNTNISSEIKQSLIHKLNSYKVITSELNKLEETKTELLEELEALQEKYNIALKAGYNGQFKQGENTTDIYPKIKELEEKIKEIDKQIEEKRNSLKELEEEIQKINKKYNDRDEIINIIKGIVSTIDLNAPEEELNQKLDQIEKYLIKLNKIDQKAFEDKYNNAKTEEEKQQLVTERENQVESYRELLKHENKEVEQLLSDRFNPLIDKFKSEIIKDKEKTDDSNKAPETPEDDKEKTDDIPKKGRLKVMATKALNWMKEHKLATVAIGLALTTAIMFAIPATHMMINSALWNVGAKLGWSASTLGKLNSINIGLSKAVAGGAYAFESMSGAYTLGGAVGAQALYGAGAANLVGAITGLTGLGAIGTFGASIINKIKNRKKKKEEEQKEVPVEETIEEKVEEVEETKNKEKELEKENEKSTPLTKEQIAEMIKAEVEKAVAAKNQEIANLTAENETLKAEIEELKKQVLQPEELEETAKKTL